MSYEGYNQKLCSLGHYTESDVYSYDDHCTCGQLFVWWNPVDSTNGDEVGIIPTEVFEQEFGTGRSDVHGPIYRIPDPSEIDPLRCSAEYDNELRKFVYLNLIIGGVHGS